MAGGEHQEKPISLFYSYSHNDEELRKRLEDHLAAQRWNGMIAEWHDRNIDVGDEWAKEIDRNLSSADIILLLKTGVTKCRGLKSPSRNMGGTGCARQATRRKKNGRLGYYNGNIKTF